MGHTTDLLTTLSQKHNQAQELVSQGNYEEASNISCSCLGSGEIYGGAEYSAKKLSKHGSDPRALQRSLVIKKLGEAMKSVGIKVKMDSDTEIIKSLLRELPDPSKGKGLSKDGEKQRKVCNALARALNDQFTPGAEESDRLIAEGDSVMKCRRVYEVLNSLKETPCMELMAIDTELRQILRNIQLAESLRESTYAELKSRASGEDVSKLTAVYEVARQEEKRQLTMLNNLLGHTMRAMGDIKDMLRDVDSAGYSLIMASHLKPGSKDYGDALAWALKSTASTAYVMGKVNEALEHVGMSMKEYRQAKSFTELNKKLDALKSKAIAKGDKDLVKFVKAVETLRESYGKMDGADEHEEDSGVEFAEVEEDLFGSAESSSASGSAYGGRYDELEGWVKEAEKDVYDLEREKMTAERKLILSEFQRVVGKEFEAWIKSIRAAAKELGHKIPISSKTADLRNLLYRAKDLTLDYRYLYLALTGLFRDASSTRTKDDFVDNLRVIRAHVSEMTEMKMYSGEAKSLLSALGRHTGELISVIDTFSDIIQQKYGSNEAVCQMVGGALSEADQKKYKLSRSNRASVDLVNAIDEFAYYHYIAKLNEGLSQTGKELDKYGKGYRGLLGDAVAARLETVEMYYKSLILAARDQLKSAPKEQEQVVDLLKERYKSVKGLYKAIQAVDLYLKDWTDSAVHNIDDLRDIKAMIANTDIIANWFSDTQGDNLCKAFDYLNPAAADKVWKSDMKVQDQESAAAPVGAGAGAKPDHYYVRLNAVAKLAPGDAVAPANAVGDPGVTNPGERDNSEDITKDNVKHLLKIKELIDDSVSNTQALKNIVSMFVTIGDKLGGKHVRKGSFMTPTQLYSALVNYMATSALKVDYRMSSVAVPGSSYEPQLTLMMQRLGKDVDNATVKRQIKEMSMMVAANMGPSMYSPLVGASGRVALGLADIAAPAAGLTLDGLVKGMLDPALGGAAPGDLVTNYQNATALVAGQLTPDVLAKLDAMPAGTDNEKLAAYAAMAKALLAAYDEGAAAPAPNDRFAMAAYAFTLEDELKKTGALDLGKYITSLNSLTSATRRFYLQPIADAQKNNIRNLIKAGTNVPSSLYLIYLAVALDPSMDAVTKTYLKAAAPPAVSKGPNKLVYRFSRIGDISSENKGLKTDKVMGVTTVGPFEDKLFTRTVKALCAKVLTVLGLYDMLEVPGKTGQISAVRMMLGGADNDTSMPEVEMGAMPLYFRLVLLAEWYRDVLLKPSGKEFSADIGKPEVPSDVEEIGLIPDVDGPFGDLIYLVFYEGKNVANGEYDEFLLRKIVRAINKIYHHYKPKYGERTVHEIYGQFRDEINRRYGIIKLSQLQKWEKLQDEKRRYTPDDLDYRERLAETTDYAVLPGEGDMEMRGEAPSDRYMSYEAAKVPGGRRAHKHSLENNYYGMLKDFRQRIEAASIFSESQLHRDPAYTTLVMRATDAARKESDKSKKFDIVRDLVQTSGSLVGIEPSKVLMTHESVMIGLQTGHAMLKKLMFLRDSLSAMDVAKMRAAIKDNDVASLSAAQQTYLHADADAVRAGYSAGGLGRAGMDSTLDVGANLAAAADPVKLAMRVRVKVEDVMRDLLEMLFNFVHKSNGLVDIKFPQTED